MGKLTTRLQEAIDYLDDYLRDRAKALDHEKTDALKQIAGVQKVILRDRVKALEQEKADALKQIACIQRLIEKIANTRKTHTVHVRSSRVLGSRQRRR